MSAPSPRLSSAIIALLLAASGVAAPPAPTRPSTKSKRPSTPATPNPAPARSTADLAAAARSSLVVLSAKGRDGVGESVGTGFVIDSSGLLVTSLHVVGEGRPVAARLVSGRELEITAIHAFDRHTDLAILRVNATNLTALPLGNSALLGIGAEVVALGNPLGLENSVVAGVLSARRPMDGIEMLQLAIPIEPGNSGGPVLDRSGQVQGVVNSKSLLTRNLGFATPADLLKPLLEHPNSVPYSRWIRTGLLDPARWEPRLGARWRQKSGLIVVDGTGSGFGGRSFVLDRNPAPAAPFDLSVSTRLDDESGAAGLVFGGDDDGRHFGFYPTGGQLRLTFFEGPDVFSWRILGTVPSAAYRPGDWNELRVRTGNGRIVCLVNGSKVFDIPDETSAGRRVGLAKFRNTSARFRNFSLRSPQSSESDSLAPELVMALGGVHTPSASLADADILALRTNLPAARSFLSARARALESEAARFRALAARLHQDQLREELARELDRPTPEINLARAALLVARHDDPDVDVEAYLRQLESLGSELKSRLDANASPVQRIDALRKFLFEENGFHGSRHDYYNRANSHLSAVLDDREGLPITLSVVFLDLARRLGIPEVSGLPLPGHFLVAHRISKDEQRLIDVFEGGRYLAHTEADEIGSEHAGVPVRSDLMRPATPREMIVRLVTNLQSFTEREDGAATSLRYADLLVAIASEPRAEAAQRIDRARLRSETGDAPGAREDLRWILEHLPEGAESERIAEMLRRLENPR